MEDGIGESRRGGEKVVGGVMGIGVREVYRVEEEDKRVEGKGSFMDFWLGE